MSLQEERKTDKTVRKVGQYILGETLGKGGYSWVKLGVDEKTKIPVALKFMMKADKQYLKNQGKQVHTEIKSMIRIDNPHVMKLYAYNLHCKYPEKTGKLLNTILLILEYCPGGELFDILYYTHQLDVVTARTYFIQMMKGVKACHDVGVCHRDIKPQNLLLDGRYQLKITDFGLSFISKEKDRLDGVQIKTSYVGTRGYQAPELLKGEKYTKSCDIFSCGVVLFILLAGYPPFEQAWREDKWYKPMCEMDSEAFWRKHSNAKLGKDCRELLTGMLAYRARNRLTLEECLKHKWVAGKETRTPRELSTVIRQKHKETRKKRRKDKKKMLDLEMSVKMRKKRIICNNCAKRGKVLDNFRCPCCNGLKDVNSLQVELPVVENFVPSLLTFFAQKTQLEKAYLAAANVFNIALQGNSETVCFPENPWNITTFVKVSDGARVHEVAVALYIREIKGTGVVAFKFKRYQGETVSFARIWDAAENCLMTYSEKIFFDSVEDVCKNAEDNKETLASVK